MAFWKKSDDPWDRKPEKRETTASWWEQDAPPAEETPGMAEELRDLGGSIKKLFVMETEAPEERVKCRWCGKDMEWGCITGGRDGVTWRNWKPKALGLKRPEGWKELDLLNEGEWVSYKTAWYCPDCGKMVLDVPNSSNYLGEKGTAEEEKREET